MNEAELDRLVEEQILQEKTPIPPPTTPTQPPKASVMPTGMTMQDFFQTLNEYEKLRQGILNTELGKMQSIENIVSKRVETALATATEGGGSDMNDEIMKEGAKILINAFASQQAQPIRPNPKPVEAPKVSPTPNTTTTENAQSEPLKEVANVTPYTQEQLENIADKIYEHYPKDVEAYKIGVVTKEQALNKLKMGGLDDTSAEAVLKVFDETDYSGE